MNGNFKSSKARSRCLKFKGKTLVFKKLMFMGDNVPFLLITIIATRKAS